MDNPPIIEFTKKQNPFIKMLRKNIAFWIIIPSLSFLFVTSYVTINTMRQTRRDLESITNTVVKLRIDTKNELERFSAQHQLIIEESSIHLNEVQNEVNKIKSAVIKQQTAVKKRQRR